MDKESPYYNQVMLLMKTLPTIAEERVFALKGGTAINLFVRDFPRLSVDIDLAYLPLETRDLALKNAKAALQRIAGAINALSRVSAVLQQQKVDELRIIVTSPEATIKIEVSPVARGTLHQPKKMAVHESVEDKFGFAEISVVSLPDLYGGKLCAAMDRQHPRDLFDVKMLLAEEGISRDIFVGFLAYVLSHPRPINEVMNPNWKPLDTAFQTEFVGMTSTPVNLEDLLAVKPAMLSALKAHLTKKDCDFLLSFKRGNPDWELFDHPDVAKLPAVRWKLRNIATLAQNRPKHTEQLSKLESALGDWRANVKSR